MRKSSLLAVFLILLASIPISLRSISQTQDERIMQEIRNELDEKYSKRLEQALKKDMGKYNKMKNDLEEIDKVKDNPGKKKGLDNYRGAHRDFFGRSIQDAGVNLNQIIAGLQQKYPGYSFSIVDDYAIAFEKRQVEPVAMHFPDPNNAEYPVTDGNIFSYAAHGPNNGPGTTEFNLPTIDLAFAQSKSASCGLGAGGNVDYGYRSIRAWTTSAVAGGCSSNGNMVNTTLIPSNVTSARLSLSGSIDVNGYALSIIGSSGANASSGISATVVEAGRSVASDGMYKQVFAPILWYASFNEARNFNFNVDLTPWKGKTLRITGSGYSFTLAAICCATNAAGRVAITTANIVTQ